MGGSLDRLKADARRDAKARLAGFGGVRTSVSAAVVEHAVSSPFWQPGASVMAYLAMRTEVDLDGLWQRSPRPSIGVPRTGAQDRSMTIHTINDPATDAVSGPLGVREPGLASPAIDPDAFDVVLVPGLAFDRAGRRLGRGGGYYDRFLGSLASGARETTFIGVCWSGQIVSNVPTGPLDRRVHMLLTEHGLTRCDLEP